MNKVTTISLNGNAFQLEDGGYETLRTYLDTAAARLRGNPDREEIISDIEQAMADKFRALLGGYKSVVSTQQVEAVLAELGPVDGGNETDAPRDAAAESHSQGKQTGASDADGGSSRRLYRLHEGAMLAGVCNGLGAYFGIDPTILRALFVVLTFATGGMWILIYVVLVFVVPSASTDAERAAAHGVASTAQEFIRRAREGYYDGMKNFSDHRARREWKRRFRREMRGWGHSLRWEFERGAHHWQQNWHRYWAEHPGAEMGWGIALPFLSLFHAALALACLVGIVSLLTHGTLFGVVIGSTIPVWLAIVILLIVYRLVIWPVKAMRHVYLHHGVRCGRSGPWLFASAWDTVVWLGFAGVLAWLAFRHMPQINEAIQAIPPTVHEAVDGIRHWWNSW